MKKYVYLLLVLMLFGSAHEAYSQFNRGQIKKNNRRMMTYRGKKFGFSREKRYNSVGLTLNALNYYGDLAPTPSRLSTDLSFTRPGVGICIMHRFGPRYILTGSFMYGTLKGADAESANQNDLDNGIFRYQRNLSFRNRIKELSIVATFDLFENQSTYISRVKWTPYAFTGLVVFHHNPQAQVPETDLDGNPFSNAGDWVNLQPLGTEGQHLSLQDGQANNGLKPYKRIQLGIPIGIGARFRLNEIMDLSFEFGFRYTFTDYLDDVSRDYIDLGAFGTNELSKALSYRTNEVATPTFNYIGRDGRPYNVLSGYGHENVGNASYPFNMRGNKKDKDIYTVTTVRLTYIIGKTFHRAKFR